MIFVSNTFRLRPKPPAAKIEKEIIELRKDNKSLAKQVEDQIKQFRNTGAL